MSCVQFGYGSQTCATFLLLLFSIQRDFVFHLVSFYDDNLALTTTQNEMCTRKKLCFE